MNKMEIAKSEELILLKRFKECYFRELDFVFKARM